MTLTISVDTGGTFTDSFVMQGDRWATGKSRTTPHDLSLGFVTAVTEAVASLGMSLEEALAEAGYVKYATTAGMNALIERLGPRVGLITTYGQEDTIHVGRSRNWADGLPGSVQMDRTRARRPPDLVERDFRIGVQERVDCFGNIVMPLDEGGVAGAVDHLLDLGVQAVAVCLTWSFMNPVHEHRIREIVRERYPDIYLGRIPVLLSSEVAPKLDEYRRMVTTVLSAYLATATENHLLDLSDRLRELGYERPLLLARNIGGVASPSRTTALHLLGAGAIAGLTGTDLLARRLDRQNVVACDMGGTTFDVGMIVEGEQRAYEFDPIVDRWRIHLPVLANASIGAGGGSIAWVTTEGRLQVGPRSAGSLPGPACYDTGGTEPTVTDADVVLGYIDPDYFLGGRIRLDRKRAERAIRRRVAEPLSMTVEEAAEQIRRLVDGTMGQEIHKHTSLKGYDPRTFTMFAFGGAGPVHACDIAEFADFTEIFTFPFGSEFNAYGAAGMDVVQTYERTHRILLYDPVRDAWFDEVDAFNSIVDGLLALAKRDLAEERFGLDEVRFQLELDMNYSGQHHTVRHSARHLRVEGADELRELANDFNRSFAGVYGAGATYPEGGIEIQLFKLTALAELEKPSVDHHPMSLDPSPKTGRACWWSGAGRVETPVFERDGVGPGARIVGPALVESADTVVAVAPGWIYEVDHTLSARLARGHL